MDVIEKARKKIAELEAEIAKLRDFVSLYVTLADDSSTEFSVERQEISGAAHGVPSPRRRVRGGSSPEMIVKVAKEAIRELGRPLTRTQLVEELEKRGLSIGGTDKSKNMGTIIWRSDEFMSVEGYGYWPKQDPMWNSHPLLR